MSQEKESRFPAAFLAGAVVVLAFLGGLLLLSRLSKTAPNAHEQRLPMDAPEQAYASHILFDDLKMTRAANLLNQEVIYVFGTVRNDGARAIREIEATLEFRDPFNQVILRDTRRVLGANARVLTPGQRRDFVFSFDHVGELWLWNRRHPAIRVTGLLLE